MEAVLGYTRKEMEMDKKRMRITSVFCALMMALSVLFTGTSTVLAASTVQKEEDKSHNTYLKDIKGVNLTINFTKFGKEFQAFDILSAATDKVKIEAEAEDPKATVKINGNENLVTGYNRISIQVTAENGINTREYGVTIYKRGSDNLSSNADLKAIHGIKLNETFNKARLNYTATVAEDVLYLDGFSFETDHAEAQAYANGVYHMLNVGENLVTINVTAQDGTIKEYKITVTREGAQDQISSNANLQGIYGLDLEETFDKNKTEYTAKVSNGVTYLYGVYAVAEDATSIVTIEGQYTTELKVGENLVKIKVFAQDGTEKVYQIKVTREVAAEEEKEEEQKPLSSNTRIKAINGIDLDDSYSNDVLSYYTLVSYKVSSLDLEVETEDSKAEVSIRGAAKKLEIGMNLIQVTVTAENGQSRVVNITVEREPSTEISSDASVSKIYGSLMLNEPIKADKSDYTAKWDHTYGANEINIDADQYANIRVSGTSANGKNITARLEYQYQGTNIFSVDNIAKGENLLSIEVTAQNGDVKIYTIKVTK